MIGMLTLLQGAALTQPFQLQPSLSGPVARAGASPRRAQCAGAIHAKARSQRDAEQGARRPSEDSQHYLRQVRRHAKRATGGESELDQLQALLGCQFRDLALLRQAVTHRSAAPKSLDSNQRLEYLGDAVLGMVVAEHLFRTFPNFDEGQLSTMRKEVVSASALAKVARREHLGRFARLNAGEEATGGRNKEALLADLVEALIAAVFVDRGLDASRALVMRWLGDEMKEAVRDPFGSDFKSKLQEQLRQIRSFQSLRETSISCACFYMSETDFPRHTATPGCRTQATTLSKTGPNTTKDSRRMCWWATSGLDGGSAGPRRLPSAPPHTTRCSCLTKKVPRTLTCGVKQCGKACKMGAPWCVSFCTSVEP